MSARNIPTIDHAPDASRATRRSDSALVEFVGGPRDGEHQRLGDTPALIEAKWRTYRRSVRCADDGALRYVFDEDPLMIAHQRWIRPC
jgi:hypothetical protein